MHLEELSSLADYQHAVGGYIQPVEIAALEVTVYVNEKGLLRQFPLNSRLTFLWWLHTPEARQRAMLVGNAVIFAPADRNGNNTSVPSEVIELLMETRDSASKSRSSEKRCGTATRPPTPTIGRQ